MIISIVLTSYNTGLIHMIMKIGLIAMSAKPYHAGHDGLVRWASKENDKVYLYVSLSDRKRPGEIPILGTDMQLIWHEQIEPSLPDNVNVTYGGSPVANVYKNLGDANDNASDDVFQIYADPEDLTQNYPEKSLIKYCGNLYANGQIILKPIERSQTVNVSGTKMRKYLSSGDKASFISNMPDSIDGASVWDILTSSMTKNKKASNNENLLRNYIAAILKN